MVLGVEKMTERTVKTGVSATGMMAVLGGGIAALILLALSGPAVLLGLSLPFDGDGSNGATVMQGPFPLLSVFVTSGEWRGAFSGWLIAATGMLGLAAIVSAFRPRSAAVLSWCAVILVLPSVAGMLLIDNALNDDAGLWDGVESAAAPIGLLILAAFLLTLRAGAPVRPRAHRILTAIAFVLFAGVLGGLISMKAASNAGLGGHAAPAPPLTLTLMGGAMGLALVGAVAVIANERVGRWVLLAAAVAGGGAAGYFLGGGVTNTFDMLAPLAGCIAGLITGVTLAHLALQARSDGSGSGTGLGLSLALVAAIPMGLGLFAGLFPQRLSAERDARQDCGEYFYTARDRAGEAVWAVSNYDGNARGCIAINASTVEYGPGVTPLPKQGSTVGLIIEIADDGAYLSSLRFTGPVAAIEAPGFNASDASSGLEGNDGGRPGRPATRRFLIDNRSVASFETSLVYVPEMRDVGVAAGWRLGAIHDGWVLQEEEVALDPLENLDGRDQEPIHLVNELLRNDTLDIELRAADEALIMRARFDLADMRAAKAAFDVEICGEPGCPVLESDFGDSIDELTREVDNLNKKNNRLNAMLRKL